MADPNIQQQLQSALGPGFVVERELGGGGMSHVFLARDLSLDRPIVVKILPAELAMGVNADRFKREIHLAAGLQHPHIVPLLSAGEASGLPYFTMPFVEGESLRARVQRGERLTAREAIGLLQDVAKALAYAHARGIVHRDIKPDNVLVSGGAAVVTDFGVAKALSSARTASADETQGSLTMVGMSLGTPSYMAPEQGAADPATDHRADIYAFGCMAYELLTGTPPFGRRPLAALLVAHLTEAPPPIEEKRPDLPAPLGTLVMRCLEKDPAKRPQSATEIVAALDEIPLSTGAIPAARAARERGRRRLVVASGVVALVLIAAVGVFLLPRHSHLDARTLDQDRVVIAPFENETGDRALEPLGKMAADWLTQGLAQTGMVKVVDAGTALGAGAAAERSGSRLEAIAAATGASRVVTGTYYRMGDSLRFRSRVIDVRTGDVVVTPADVVGIASNPTAVLDLLRQRLLGAMAVRYNPALASWAAQSRRPPTYDAYQEFVRATEIQMRGGATSERAQHLERAVALDSSFAQAWLWLANAYVNLGRRARADSVLARMRPQRNELSAFDGALFDLMDAQLHGTPDGQVLAARALASSAPGSEWRIVLVEYLLAANRPHEALDTLSHIDPDQGMLKGSPAHIGMRMSAYHLLGDGAHSVALAREEAARYPDIRELAGDQALAYVTAHDWPEVERRAAEILARPRTASFVPRTVLRSLAGEIRWHGDSALAQSILERVRASYEAQPESLTVSSFRLGLAHTLFQLGRYREARPWYVKVDSALGHNGEVASRLMVVDALLGDSASSARWAAQARAAASSNYLAVRQLMVIEAEIAAQRGAAPRAIALLRDALAQGYPAGALHGDVLLLPLVGRAEFDAMVAPRG